ncbi:hypothetical protein FHETE_6958 [Fusarium heterosporum]|uniref:(S)-ureidoglycine aminohydrolase cupin domain-containing protein n=1 Tax=Fusarium heterosporum TaxID=42747 RepID=A0A8H5T9Q4_FUSHE|nr:hypothetical protein FHETE_6958 [Fusarium heterosporum]
MGLTLSKIVPLTIIKGAGHEQIEIPEGDCAVVADFHSIQTQTTDKPAYLTTGFYRVVPGPTRYGSYDYEETKYVLRGQIDVTDEATGITHHLVAGDWAFFHVGSKAQFSTKSEGLAFYAVTRKANDTPHINLKGREESTSKTLTIMGRFSFFEGHSTSCDTIIRMLNEHDEKKRDEMTKNWRNHKVEELNFVGTLGALLASCLSSTSSWPDVLPNGRNKPWLVRTMWFSGLVFALFSVVIAGVQSMRLHRLSSHPDGLKMIRDSLGRKRLSDNKALPSWLQVYAWEFSLAFLVLAVLCMVVGLTILIWAGTEYGPQKPKDASWWDGNSKASDVSCAFLQSANSTTSLDGSDVYNHLGLCIAILSPITIRSIQAPAYQTLVAGLQAL